MTVEPVYVALIGLRLDPSEAGRLGEVIPLPLEPNTSTTHGDQGALWLGPNEWLIVGEPGTQADLTAALEAALISAHHSVVDVSANRVAFDLGAEGPGLLAAGCTLDLHPRHWTSGSCAQTIVGSVPTLLHQRPEGTRAYIRPSYAAWLTAWLSAVRI